jgi:hypothetical protein
MTTNIGTETVLITGPTSGLDRTLPLELAGVSSIKQSRPRRPIWLQVMLDGF